MRAEHRQQIVKYIYYTMHTIKCVSRLTKVNKLRLV